MEERNGQPTQQPTPAQNDGTPTNDPAAALHWAAEAINLAARREAKGRYLNTDEQANFGRYQTAARSHGYSDEQIHAHAQTLRPGGAA